ncbi:Z1 domain-containing protein [Arthrobacter sp. EPSL27]|uniref:Z1 domain-containing protein n=1 Tax=Arthrobacter sp. EPSL27 TaxID=1745378 RepID=UPI0009EA3772|nr:Z1 domain-containing protein [Arthrobacter sp. EPSL27]
MPITETRNDAITSAIAMIAEKGPKLLLNRVNFSLEEDGVETIAPSELTDLLTREGDPNDPAQVEFRLALSRWDQTTDAQWLSEAPRHATHPKGPERRAYVLGKLGFSEHEFAAINSFYPIIKAGTIVANLTDDGRWPWYSSERRTRSHYWDVYQGILKRRGFDPDAIVALDESTTEIVSRFADPTWDETYQTKGLVVGHVQSGKTANFTGTVAKAIDAGYRLIIVLTGTLELLRSQTQRRLDKELVGFENIVGGIDLSDEALARENIDYIANQDADWLAGDKFVKFGYDPESVPGVPHIIRLTKSTDDYRSLRAGLSTLDYKSNIRNQQKIYHPDNLWDTPVRLVVIKKNAAVLRKLIKDLKQIRGNTQDYPALIVDDEADQAGINTKKPPVKLTKEEQDEENKQTRERTAINKLLSELLGILPRAQYVGYTATPFANVFIDASDVDDIYPKDFIFSLTPPDAYMGGRSFHDRHLLLAPDETKTAATSNQAAYVRNISSTPNTLELRQREMQRAMDSFVLSGAIKLWRQARGSKGDFKHHTMLFHESVRQVEHNALADEIHKLWKRSDYLGFDGYDRMAELWADDFSVVMQELTQRTDSELPDPRTHPIPSSFDDVAVYLPEVVKRVEDGIRPIAVVNGDKDSEYTQAGADFQKGPVWKMLVGGAKLSRGYTIEGLTVTWYSRRALAADTLMQMGRWFGYRPGYRDLVRLYIGRNVPASARNPKPYDLYEAFESMIADEEEFRDQLEQFAELDENGQPQVRPIDIPPLVSQSLPWLRPTARSRMYNAQIVQYAKGDRFKDFFYLPPREPNQSKNRENLTAMAPVLKRLTDLETFQYTTATKKRSSYEAQTGLVPAQVVIDALSLFEWSKPGLADADIQFVKEAISKGTITDFKVVMPIPSRDPVIRMIDLDEMGATRFPIIERNRRERGDFSGSSRWTRQPLEDQFTKEKEPNDPSSRTTGTIILTLAADQWSGGAAFSEPTSLPADVVDPADIATLFSWALPHAAAPKGKAGFSVRAPDRPDALTIEVP